MVHNALHHAFFVTVSFAKNVHQKHYDELLDYVKKFGIYHGLKAEDVEGEGKVHLHAIHIRDFEEVRPYDKERAIDQYGPRRASDTKTHILKCCPQINTDATSKFSIKVDVLTSSQWIEYLNKETHMHVNNFPDDFCLVTQYFSEKVVRDADPGLVADEKKYHECAKDGHSWAIPEPTQQSCRRFYRWSMNVNRAKKVCLDPNTIKKKGEALWRFMTQSVYTDDEDDPKNGPASHAPTKFYTVGNALYSDDILQKLN